MGKKAVNPAQAYNQALRKQEVKKNKKNRQLQRQESAKDEDPQPWRQKIRGMLRFCGGNPSTMAGPQRMALQSARDRLKLILRAQGLTISKDDPDLFDKQIESSEAPPPTEATKSGSVTSLMPASLRRKRNRTPDTRTPGAAQSAAKRAAGGQQAPSRSGPAGSSSPKLPNVASSAVSSAPAIAGEAAAASVTPAVPSSAPSTHSSTGAQLPANTGFSLFAPAPAAVAASGSSSISDASSKPPAGAGAGGSSLAAEYDDFMAQLEAM